MMIRRAALPLLFRNRNDFGKLYTYYVDGAVYAQPLYVPAVAVSGRSSDNVPYTGTVNVL
jgi:hypothetical protein